MLTPKKLRNQKNNKPKNKKSKKLAKKLVIIFIKIVFLKVQIQMYAKTVIKFVLIQLRNRRKFQRIQHLQQQEIPKFRIVCDLFLLINF